MSRARSSMFCLAAWSCLGATGLVAVSCAPPPNGAPPPAPAPLAPAPPAPLRLLAELPAPGESRVTCLAFSPGGQMVAALSHDGLLQVWAVSTRQKVAVI